MWKKLLFILFVLNSFVLAEDSQLQATFKQHTFENTFIPLRNMSVTMRCTHLSNDLINVWQSTQDSVKALQIDSLKQTIQEQGLFFYLLEIDPGHSSNYIINFKKIKKKARLYMADKKGKGKKPKRVTGSLAKELVANQKYYGILTYQVDPRDFYMQTLEIEAQYKYSNKNNFEEIKEKAKHKVQFSFHGNGAPNESQLKTAPSDQDITGFMNVVVPIVETFKE